MAEIESFALRRVDWLNQGWQAKDISAMDDKKVSFVVMTQYPPTVIGCKNCDFTIPLFLFAQAIIVLYFGYS